MIPLAVPNLTAKEAEYTSQAIASGHVGPDGPFVERFEEMVAKASGRKWAVATITGTAALHTAAYVLWYRGIEMIVPRHAFPAARNVLRNLGCEIVGKGNGVNHDVQFYRKFCDRAPAIGEAPTDALLECYSFAANKVVTCGHGGAVVGDQPWLHEAVRRAIVPGYGRPGVFNYRMANLNAAMGCAQMERLEELKAAKKRIWARYAEAIPMLDRGPSRWMATADIAYEYAQKLEEMGIGCRIEPSGGISLPCSTHLTETDQDIVIARFLSLFQGGRTPHLSPPSSGRSAVA